MRGIAAAFVVSLLVASPAARAREPIVGDEPLAREPTAIAAAPDALAGIEDTAPTDPLTTDEDLAEDAALAGVALEVESIAVRLRRLRATQSRTSLWPRITLHVSWASGAPVGLAREAGVPDALSLDAHEGLTWSVFATWGAR